jgi:hypothetical protein
MAGQNPYGTPIPAGSTRAAPMNKNAAAGVAQLPPNHEPIFARQQGCAMTGPIFRYDGSIANAGQFPPQFNRKWLISGCDGYGYHLVTLDSAGEKILSNVQIFKTIGAIYLVDLKQGPDGALYYVSWSTGLYKIEYTGACRDAGLLPEKTGCATAGAPNYDPSINPAYHDPRLCGTTSAVEPTAEPAPWLHVDGRSVSVSASGWHVLTISDMRGRVLHRVEGAGAMTYALPSFSGTGLYQVRVVTARGSAVRMLPRL